MYMCVSPLTAYAFLSRVRPVPLGSIPSALVGVSVVGQWFLPGYCLCFCWGPYLLVSNSIMIDMFSSLVLCASERLNRVNWKCSTDELEAYLDQRDNISKNNVSMSLFLRGLCL